MRENLWLNLTDGSILCGRRYFDGSGGNNHAVEHYRETNYPLAVKLGTITPDGAGTPSPPPATSTLEWALTVTRGAREYLLLINNENVADETRASAKPPKYESPSLEVTKIICVVSILPKPSDPSTLSWGWAPK